LDLEGDWEEKNNHNFKRFNRDLIAIFCVKKLSVLVIISRFCMKIGKKSVKIVIFGDFDDMGEIQK